jgi:transcriptional regulator with XRE-family HTH domain
MTIINQPKENIMSITDRRLPAAKLLKDDSRGITQFDIADIAGVSQALVSQVLRGRAKNAKVEQAEQKRRTLEDATAEDERKLATVRQTRRELRAARYNPDDPMDDSEYAELNAPLLATEAELEERLSQPRAELERLPSPWSIRGYKATTTIPESVDGRAWLRKLPDRSRGHASEAPRRSVRSDTYPPALDRRHRYHRR